MAMNAWYKESPFSEEEDNEAMFDGNGRKTDVLSPDSFKQELVSRLKSHSISGKIRAQLRASILSDLRKPQSSRLYPPEARAVTGSVPGDTISPTTTEEQSTADRVSNGNTELLTALNSIVIEHLQRAGYDYTLSVFLPESGLEKRGFDLHSIADRERKQISNVLGLSDGFLQSQSSDSSSYRDTILSILAKYASVNGNDTDNDKEDTDVESDVGKENQANEDIDENENNLVDNVESKATLESRLRQLDDELVKKQSVAIAVPSLRSVESQMAEYQAECDKRVVREVEFEMARFKEEALVKMRNEEREKYRESLADIRTSYERRESERVRQWQTREEELSMRISKKEHELDSALFRVNQQQVLLDEEAKGRESIRQREATLVLKTAETQENEAKRRIEDYNTRILRLDQERRIEKEEFERERERMEASISQQKQSIADKQKELDDMWRRYDAVTSATTKAMRTLGIWNSDFQSSTTSITTTDSETSAQLYTHLRILIRESERVKELEEKYEHLKRDSLEERKSWEHDKSRLRDELSIEVKKRIECEDDAQTWRQKLKYVENEKKELLEREKEAEKDEEKEREEAYFEFDQIETAPTPTSSLPMNKNNGHIAAPNDYDSIVTECSERQRKLLNENQVVNESIRDVLKKLSSYSSTSPSFREVSESKGGSGGGYNRSMHRIRERERGSREWGRASLMSMTMCHPTTPTTPAHLSYNPASTNASAVTVNATPITARVEIPITFQHLDGKGVGGVKVNVQSKSPPPSAPHRTSEGETVTETDEFTSNVDAEERTIPIPTSSERVSEHVSERREVEGEDENENEKEEYVFGKYDDMNMSMPVSNGLGEGGGVGGGESVSKEKHPDDDFVWKEEERVEEKEEERVEYERSDMDDILSDIDYEFESDNDEEEEAEKKRLEEEAAEKKRLEKEAAEKKRLEKEAAEKKRLEEEAAEKKRLEKEAAEKKRKEAAEKKRLEEEAAEKKRKEAAEKKRLEEEAAEKKRLEEEEEEEEERERRRIEEEEAAERRREQNEVRAAKREKIREEQRRKYEAKAEEERKKKESEETVEAFQEAEDERQNALMEAYYKQMGISVDGGEGEEEKVDVEVEETPKTKVKSLTFNEQVDTNEMEEEREREKEREEEREREREIMGDVYTMNDGLVDEFRSNDKAISPLMSPSQLSDNSDDGMW